jgi:hypothetical protein
MVAKPASIRTPATDCPSNIHGLYVLSRRILLRYRPASRMDAPPRSHWLGNHTYPPNASRSCPPDRRRWPKTRRIPQSLPERCLSAHRAHLLEQPPALRRRRRKWWPQPLRQLRSFSLGNSLVGPSRSIGSCPPTLRLLPLFRPDTSMFSAHAALARTLAIVARLQPVAA